MAPCTHLNGFAKGNGFHDHKPEQKVSLRDTNGTKAEYQQHELMQPRDFKYDFPANDGDGPHLFVISAKSKESLKASIEGLRAWIKTKENQARALSRLSRTLITRRSVFSWRASIVGTTSAEVAFGLSSVRLNKAPQKSEVVLLFTGQGAQYATMGRELLGLSEVFTSSLHKSQEVLHSLGASWNLIEELLKPESESRINTSHISQPATTAIQIALVTLLDRIGVQPAAVLGHSSGEVTAAFAAGMIDQETALKISYRKAFVAQWCRGVINGKGAMLAVGLGEQAVSKYLDSIVSGKIVVACVNSPSSVTISGDEKAVVDLKLLLDQDAVFNRRLKVDVAYHSHHMLLIADRFEDSLHGLSATKPIRATKFFSSTIGDAYHGAPGPSYWVDNLVSKVRFSEGLERLVSVYGGGNTNLSFIEVGPHSALEGPLRQFMTTATESNKWTYSPSLVRNRDASQAILELGGRLWEQGVSVDLCKVITLYHDGQPRGFEMINDLPAYSWDHTKVHWHESRLSREYRHRKPAPHDLLGLRLPGTTNIEPVFRLILSVDEMPWLRQHMIDGFALYPGSAFLVHAIQGLKQVTDGSKEVREIYRYHFKDVYFTKSIVMPDPPATVELLISLRPSEEVVGRLGIIWYHFRVTSHAADDTWNDNCHGLVGYEHASEPVLADQDWISSRIARQMRAATEKCTQQMPTSELYECLRRNGVDYGDKFSIIESLKIGQRMAFGEVVVPDIAECMPSQFMQPHVIHPATFDAFMHIALPLYHRFCCEGPVMLTSIKEGSIAANILNKPNDSITVVCELKGSGHKSGRADVSILQEGENGQLIEVGCLKGEEFRSIGEGVSSATRHKTTTAISCSIDWVPAGTAAAVHQQQLGQKLQLLLLVQNEQIRGILANATELLRQHAEVQVALLELGVRGPGEDSVQVIVTDEVAPEQLASRVLMNGTRSQHVLWCDISQDTNQVPQPLAPNMLQRQGANLVLLRYADPITSAEAFAETMLEVIHRSLLRPEDQIARDYRYEYREGRLLVPRLRQHDASTRRIRASFGEELEEVGKLHGEHALTLDFRVPGLLSSARFVPNKTAESPPAPDELKVKIYAHAVNTSDVAVAMGRASPSNSMTGEFAGVVVEVGADLQLQYKFGDRVCGLGAPPFANTAKVHHEFVQPIEDSISFEQGAAVPQAFVIAYHALMNIAQLEKSHCILILGGAGAVGQAAISIAQNLEADILATVASQQEAHLLTEAQGLSQHCIALHRTRAFREHLEHQLGGRGINVVLNCASRDLVDAIKPFLADPAVIVDAGLSGDQFSLPHFDKDILYSSLSMESLKTKKPMKLRDAFMKAMAMYKSGSITKPSTISLPVTELEKAFRLVNTQQCVGKVILTVEENVAVRQVLSSPSVVRTLRPNACYAVIDGTDMINRSLCGFLADCGAAKIISIVYNNGDQGRQTKILGCEQDLSPCCEWLQIDVGDHVQAEAALVSYRGRLAGIINIEPATLNADGQGPMNRFDAQHCSPFVQQAGASQALDFMITISQHPLTSGAAVRSMQHLCPTNVRLDGLPRHQMREHVLRVPFIADSFEDNLLPSAQGTSRLPQELAALLEYCLSTAEGSARPLELVMIRRGQIQPDESNAIFSDLPQVAVTSGSGSNGPQLSTLNESLALNNNPGAVRKLVEGVVCEQLATFCAVDCEDIRLDFPIADIGLDSLLAIEFKNWVVRTLQAPMQTTEILDASSLHDLINLIILRSKLINHEIANNGTAVMNGHKLRASPCQPAHENGLPLEVEAQPLPPPLPLPKLSDLVEKHLSGVRPFASNEEYGRTQRLAQDFQAEGGLGVRLYERMEGMKADDPENWYHDLFLNNQYLSRKGPLAPYMLFFFTHPQSQVQHTQADRAALIASTLIEYKRNLDNGVIKPRHMNEQPLCMDLYKNLFNACRQPKTGLDAFARHPANDFFVVLRKGHIYRVDYGGLPVGNTFASLEATFTQILKSGSTDIDWLGILSGEHRTSWARNYQAFVENSNQNADYMRTIQASAFIICLDDGSPETAEERARQIHFGDGSNRWFDKSVEYIVCSNGVSGMLADHTGLDAPTVADINLAIAAAIQNHEPSTVKRNGHGMSVGKVEHTGFDGFDSNVHRVMTWYHKTIAIRRHFFTSFDLGSTFMREHKVAPNSGYQLIVQLASRYFFGYLPSCWETVLQTIFHKGRVEINQVVTVEVADFVQAVTDGREPLSVCKRKFTEAARRHAGNILAVTRSGGSDRFLSLLREISKDGEEDPELYKDPAYMRSRPRKIMSSCFKTHMAENGCVQRDDDSIWLHFEVDADR